MTKHPTTAFLEVSPKSILSGFCELFLSKMGTSQESAAGDRTLNRCSYITANKKKPNVRQKNRYNNIIPYDSSRVSVRFENEQR